MNTYAQLDAWIDAHFDEQVRFLQELIRVPTDTPPGNNAPHAERTAELLRAMGLDAEKHPVPEAEVHAAGLESITNLVVRRSYGPGKTVLLNAHGDVVPARRRLDPRPLRWRDRRRQDLWPRRRRQQVRLLHLRLCRARARSRGASPRPAGRTAVHLRRRIWRRSRPGLAAQAQDHPPRPDDCRRLQLPGHHRAQRLPADGSHRARQDGARRHSRLGRRRPAGGGAHPQRAVRAEHAVQTGQLQASKASPTPT